MNLQDILKQLEKEKDPLKYLQDLLKKIQDKKLKQEIEKLIEKLKKDAEKKEAPHSLEQVVQNISPRTQRVETESLENYASRTITRVRIPTPIFQQEEKKPKEDYGSNIKSDYITSNSEFTRSLKNSGLISRTGFTSTAETKDAVRERSQDKNYNLDREETISYHNETDFQMREDLTGLTSDLKETHKKRKGIQQYHE